MSHTLALKGLDMPADLISCGAVKLRKNNIVMLSFILIDGQVVASCPAAESEPA